MALDSRVLAVVVAVAAFAAAAVIVATYAGGGDNVADSTTTLSPEEIEGILWVREEEKLARDVYLTLYEMWGLQVFANIAESEQRHMDAVLKLIETYGLEDPAQDEIGVFTNPQIQELYNQLVEWGSQSLVDAILVGAYIEELDILDLQERIEAADNPDIIQTYENLMSGSVNHLKAFAAQYEKLTGEPYTPQLLDEETYKELMSG